MIKKYYCNRPDIQPDTFTVMVHQVTPFPNKVKIEASSYDPFCFHFIKQALVQSGYHEFETFYSDVVDLRGYESIMKRSKSKVFNKEFPSHKFSFMYDKAFGLPDPFLVMENAFADYCNSELWARIELEEIINGIENVRWSYSFEKRYFQAVTLTLICKIKSSAILEKRSVTEWSGLGFESYVTEAEKNLLDLQSYLQNANVLWPEIADNCGVQLDISFTIAKISLALQKIAKLKNDIFEKD